MDTKNIKKSVSIYNLPDETIATILRHCSIREILNFSITCKHFNDIISNQSLWRHKFKNILPDAFKRVQELTDGDWFKEIKQFYMLRKQLYNELILMSPKYWRKDELNFDDIKHFYSIAISDKLNFYYTIYILQNLIKKGNRVYDECYGKKPFTLTEMFYAKIILRYLIHIYLTIKWGIASKKNELTPLYVIKFFTQWIDTYNLYSDEEVDNKIEELTKSVILILSNGDPSNSSASKIQDSLSKGHLNERKVFSAITHVIYKENNIVVVPIGNLDTLNIKKVLKQKCGNTVLAAIVYHEIAEKLGVQCEFITPNRQCSHVFLKRRHEEASVNYIRPSTGEPVGQHLCPHLQENANVNFQYNPLLLLSFIYYIYKSNMGASKDGYFKSSILLENFLNTQSVYREISLFVTQSATEAVVETPFNVKCLNDAQLNFMQLTSDKCFSSNTTTDNVNENIVVKRRDGNIRFAVGMICYHKDLDYVCIIRNWWPQCPVTERPERSRLHFGHEQPFYSVVAADQSERFVAQENLFEMTRPTRLYHLEDFIAQEFSHFDGFAYVLNDEKKIEYPQEAYIIELYRNRAYLKPDFSVMF